jgi:hypothetical protein
MIENKALSKRRFDCYYQSASDVPCCTEVSFPGSEAQQVSGKSKRQRAALKGKCQPEKPASGATGTPLPTNMLGGQ